MVKMWNINLLRIRNLKVESATGKAIASSWVITKCRQKSKFGAIWIKGSERAGLSATFVWQKNQENLPRVWSYAFLKGSLHDEKRPFVYQHCQSEDKILLSAIQRKLSEFADLSAFYNWRKFQTGTCTQIEIMNFQTRQNLEFYHLARSKISAIWKKRRG